jgi:Domain of unknown function (DUF5615)
MYGFYMDVHVPRAITRALRLRGVHVFTAQDEGTDELPDDLLLEAATFLQCSLVTLDVRFRVMAEEWQRAGRHFAGLFATKQLLEADYGWFIDELELIAKASQPNEWDNRIEYLPLT